MMIEFDRNQMDADANATDSLGPRLEALSQRIAGIVSWFESQPNDSVVLSGLVDSLRLSGRRLDRRADNLQTYAAYLRRAGEDFVRMHQSILGEVPPTDVISPAGHSSGGGAGGSQASPLTQEQQEELFRDINRQLIEVLLSNCPTPDMLLSILKMRDTGGFTKFINGVWASINFDFRNAIQDPVKKRQYLFKNALNALGEKSVELFKDPTGAWNIFDDKNGFNKAMTFDSLMEMVSADGITVDRQVFSELFEKYAKGEITPQMLNRDLRFSGVPVDSVNSVMDKFDKFKVLDTVSEMMGAVGDGYCAFNNAADVYNQLQIVNSLDPAQLLETARVYQQSGDAEMISVGNQLERLASADMGERITMIASGQLLDMGLDTLADMGGSAVKDVVGSANPYLATVSLTTTALDALTGVNDVPKQTNELLFAGDAAETTYAVFQKDYAAYQANPSEGNLQSAMSSYKAYCRTAIDAQNACAKIYDSAMKTAAGSLFVSEEARGYSQQCKDSVTAFDKKLTAIDQYYDGYVNGTRPNT